MSVTDRLLVKFYPPQLWLQQSKHLAIRVSNEKLMSRNFTLPNYFIAQLGIPIAYKMKRKKKNNNKLKKLKNKKKEMRKKNAFLSQ